VKRLGSMGSRVMVERLVGVEVGKGVLVTTGAPGTGEVVGSEVLMTNRFGVNVGFSEKGVAVGWAALIGVGLCRKDGSAIGSPLQPDSTDTSIVININLFITPLQ
jgi:hypothetical protein